MSAYPLLCQHCGALLQVQKEWAGQTSTCPRCKTPLQIPTEEVLETMAQAFAENAQRATSHRGMAMGSLVVAFFVPIVGFLMAYYACYLMRRDGNDDGLRWAKAAKIVAFLNMLLNCYLLYRHPELLSFPFLQQPQSSSGILP